MKTNNFKTALTRTFHNVSFKVKKHSPEILVTAGVVGVVASTVMACKATTKLSGILDNAKKEIDTIHAVVENPEILPEGERYTEEDSKKDLAIVYTKTGVELVKLYAPAIALGTLSIVSIVSSHHILRKRNVALAAAYATVDKSFKKYRGRVIERFGEELDKELRYNVKAKEIETTEIDENGKQKKVKKTVNVVNPTEVSDYARFFDESCAAWDKNPEYNLMFLRQQQAWANDLLKERGHLFLNEVYDMLGMQRTQAGNIVGWVYDMSENPEGDNFVDFGIYDIHNEAKRDFVNGYERSILLDFNVDGDIWSLMR